MSYPRGIHAATSISKALSHIDDSQASEDSDQSSDNEEYPNTVDTGPSKRFITKLRAKREKSSFSKTPFKFIPEGVIDTLVDENLVRQCLGPGDYNDLVDFIITHAKKAFAIVTIKRHNSHRAMRWFKREGLTDKDLPLTSKAPKYNKSWRLDFCEAQWMFCAPTFHTKRHNHDLMEEHILPFISVSNTPTEGAFGEVLQYRIHPSHLDPQSVNHSMVAVKEMKPRGKLQDVAEHWEKEVKALRMMNGLNQDHIVRFITAFRRYRENFGVDHYLIFEWANGGNLYDLWRRTPVPDSNPSLVKAVVGQIWGLASALREAHNPHDTPASYRHGDLKPENILVFSKDEDEVIGTLKIGDWGEAKYHGENQPTEFRSKGTTAQHGTRRYEAPEVIIGVKAKYLGQSTTRRSRLYDIWAMGCITLEFIVWLLYGLEGLKRFNHDVDGATFYQISIENGHKVAQVHKAALRWIEHLADAFEVGTTAIGDLLALVKNQLLVVNLPRRGGTMVSDQASRSRSPTSFSSTPLGDESDYPPNLSMDTLTVALDEAASTMPKIEVTPPSSGSVPHDERIPVQPEPEKLGQQRCLASDFRDQMYLIYSEDDSIGYWDTCQKPALPSTSVMNVVASSSSTKSNREGVEQDAVDYKPIELDENIWKPRLENSWASKLLSNLRLHNRQDLPRLQPCGDLCDKCSAWRSDIWDIGFSKTYEMNQLSKNARSKTCDMCALLFRTCERTGADRDREVIFERQGAFLMIEGNETALSIVSSPFAEVPFSNDYQIGFVELPDAGEAVHLSVLRQWLHTCDTEQEHNCKPNAYPNDATNASNKRFPTRLLDVGSLGSDKVSLKETTAESTGDWIALSHHWGAENYSTTKENLQHHRDGIRLEKFPATFQDAIKITRELGIRYLWIDSLCIIQGPGGDFEVEAERMEEVYSGAYCVIAASCAEHHYSGFLKPRRGRNYVQLAQEDGRMPSVYLCENIDRFKEHVLDGSLNQRGWVLQEHALARRTIFFTEHQTYFECGNGVCCETSTRMSNTSAAFLGDAEFPNLLYKASQAAKIQRIQDLYKRYSRFGLSHAYDRPIAISGLQRRLLDKIGVKGDYGILDEGETRGLLRRTLLWTRDEKTPEMERIRFPENRKHYSVPSWSWMAYTGGIDYLNLGYGLYDWADIQSPWTQQTTQQDTSTETSSLKLIVAAQMYDLSVAGDSELELIFDDPSMSSLPRTRCVVLGRAKGSPSPDKQNHCVLIIASTSSVAGIPVYERIGAGILPGKCILPEKETVHVQ